MKNFKDLEKEFADDRDLRLSFGDSIQDSLRFELIQTWAVEVEKELAHYKFLLELLIKHNHDNANYIEYTPKSHSNF